jgi:hypothetical protein
MIRIQLFLFSFFIIGCECLHNDFAFTERASFIPENRTLHIGDTLWFHSRFSCTQMVNLNFGDTVSFCEIPDMVTTLGVGKLVPDSSMYGEALGAISRFTFINAIGGAYDDNDVIRPELTLTVRFSHNSGFYEILIGLIPKEQGNFTIYVGNRTVALNDKKSKCENRGDFSFEISNADKHLEILHAFYQTLGIENYSDDNSYFFEVSQ